MSLKKPFRHALPVSDLRFFDRLYLVHAGWERVKQGSGYPQSDAPMYFFDWNEGRILPETCLAMVTAGEGELETDQCRISLSAGDVFILHPGEWHRHRPSSRTGWTLLWVVYHGSDAALWQRERRYHLKGNLAVIEDRDLFMRQFERLIESVHRHPASNPANFTRQLVGLLSHFLTNDPDGPVTSHQETGDELVNRAVDYIWNFSHGSIDVPTVARHVGIARRTLDRRFMAARGHTVLEEIQNCRLSRAARLLGETDMSVKEIVMRTGFSSGEHLRLAFRKVYGTSPYAFRKASGVPSGLRRRNHESHEMHSK